MYKFGLEYATAKANSSWWKAILLGLLGGFFVGIGYIGYHTIHGIDVHNGTHSVAAKFLGALMFPAGLLLIVVLGGSLFTSHSLIMLSVLEKKVRVRVMLVQWLWALIGNAIGCALIAAIAAWSGHYEKNSDTLKVAIKIAQGKSHWAQWWKYLLSGIICNVLVAGTVWGAVAYKENKAAVVIIIIFLITFFAVVAPQHIVANMYAYFIAAFAAPDSFNHGAFIVGNLLPTMIGNVIGGGIFLPVVFWLIYSYKTDKIKVSKA